MTHLENRLRIEGIHRSLRGRRSGRRRAWDAPLAPVGEVGRSAAPGRPTAAPSLAPAPKRSAAIHGRRRLVGAPLRSAPVPARGIPAACPGEPSPVRPRRCRPCVAVLVGRPRAPVLASMLRRGFQAAIRVAAGRPGSEYRPAAPVFVVCEAGASSAGLPVNSPGRSGPGGIHAAGGPSRAPAGPPGPPACLLIENPLGCPCVALWAGRHGSPPRRSSPHLSGGVRSPHGAPPRCSIHEYLD